MDNPESFSLITQVFRLSHMDPGNNITISCMHMTKCPRRVVTKYTGFDVYDENDHNLRWFWTSDFSTYMYIDLFNAIVTGVLS